MKHLFSCVLLAYAFSGIAQSNDGSSTSNVINFSVVETIPKAPGCDENLSSEESMICCQQYILNHVAENYQFPKEAKKRGVQGKIYVNFIVEKDASVSNVEIVKGLGPVSDKELEAVRLAEEEAVRVVRSLHFEKPAYQRGKPVRMSFTLPINLTLEGGNFWDIFKRKKD